MTDSRTERVYNQASLPWKAAAYVLIAPVIGLGLYGAGRFLIATFIIASSTDTSLYQLFCLPATIFTTPLLTVGLPYFLLRDVTQSELRNYMIGAGVLLVIAVAIILTAPDVAAVLWGL